MAQPNENLAKKLLPSAARTASINTQDQKNYFHRGVQVIIDVTAVSATPSIVFTIQGKDPFSGKYYDILESAAVTATGTTVLKVYPGIAATSNVSASDNLPREWRVEAVAADADSATYSISANMLV